MAQQVDITALIGEATEYDKKQMLEERKPKSWLKSVSAFANGEGGALIFGIADSGEIVGLKDAQHDAEIISEQVKTKMDPVPEVNLSFHKTDDGKELVVLRVRSGHETPYFYFADGNRTAFVRIGNESVPADDVMLKRLVLKGYKRTFDSLPSGYKFERMAFTKLKSICYQRTHTDFLDSDYESWGLVDENGKLTNAGALLADECPIRYSRVFCTRWNGKD
jgi:predicted HTH transcriptional regulator